jgi:hypothetical protein
LVGRAEEEKYALEDQLSMQAEAESADLLAPISGVEKEMVFE